MSRPNPKLPEPPLEADISDLCPSNNFHSGPTSFLPPSTAASSALLNVTSLDESFNDLPDTSQPLRHEQEKSKGLQRKQNLGHLPSPPPPSLTTSLGSIEVDRIAVHCSGFPRSRSLPGVKPRKGIVDVDSIAVAPEVLKKLRRWIMGIAIGGSTH